MAWIRKRIMQEELENEIRRSLTIRDIVQLREDLVKLVKENTKLFMGLDEEILDCDDKVEQYLHHLDELQKYQFILLANPFGPMGSVLNTKIISVEEKLIDFQSKLWKEGYQMKKANDRTLKPIRKLDVSVLPGMTLEQLQEVLMKIREEARKAMEWRTWLQNFKVDWNEKNLAANIWACILWVVHLQGEIEATAAYYIALSAFSKAVQIYKKP